MDRTQKLRAFFRRAVVVAFALSAATPDALDLPLALRAEFIVQAAPVVGAPTIPSDLGWSAVASTDVDDDWDDGPAPWDSDRESNDVCLLVWPELGLAFQASKPSNLWHGLTTLSSHPISIGRRDGCSLLAPARRLSRSPSLYSVLCRLVC